MNHKDLFAKRIASFLKEYIHSECSEIQIALHNLNSIKKAYVTLQKLYLLNFVINKLYKAEYPQVFRRLSNQHPEIELFSTWFKIIKDYILIEQQDGNFILGGNALIKHQQKFYLTTHTQQTFLIKFSEIIGYPPETDKIADLPELEKYKNKKPTHNIQFTQESKLQNLFNSKINDLHKQQPSKARCIF